MRVFIVHAHHEAKSFNGAMTQTAQRALLAAGHEVLVSDLYAMGFDPVSDRRNFTTVRDPLLLRQQTEESYASEHNGFVPELQAEMDKLFWAEALILQFPLWWFGLPAILKGWVDRVFAVGRAYGGRRWFDRGVFAGRRAMCSVTVGGLAPMYSYSGINGPMSAILFPINHGILAFTGFTVVEPFVVHGPGRITPAQRSEYLELYRYRVLGLASANVLPGPNTADYDESLVRKAGISPADDQDGSRVPAARRP
ncbi:MAG: NAD(P)H-dependent oxidoreductase [Gammaproteobacteria bacterium]|nr:NAD(P)H-dependent oxidoreductase [Gammaproteobacteria bacterium]